jgi:hypothetical protein
VAEIERLEENGVSLTLDASGLIQAAQESGVRLALHGHQHSHKIAKYAGVYYRDGKWRGLDEEVYVLASGSAGANERRLPRDTPNTYTILDFGESGTQVVMRTLRLDGEEAPTICSLTLPVRPE